MGLVKGGLLEVGITDGTNTVTSSNVHEDIEYDEVPQTVGLADGQQANASKDVSGDFFLLDLSETEASQLRTWEDNETKVQVYFGLQQSTVSWADPSYLKANEQRSGRGELSGVHVQLMIER